MCTFVRNKRNDPRPRSLDPSTVRRCFAVSLKRNGWRSSRNGIGRRWANLYLEATMKGMMRIGRCFRAGRNSTRKERATHVGQIHSKSQFCAEIAHRSFSYIAGTETYFLGRFSVCLLVIAPSSCNIKPSTSNHNKFTSVKIHMDCRLVFFIKRFRLLASLHIHEINYERQRT